MPEFLLFRSGAHDYALPVGAVLAVGAAAATVPLPYAPPHVEGVTGIFDRIVPQQSLMALIGLSGDSDGERTLILVDDGAGGTALRISAVDKVVSSRTTPRRGHDDQRANPICCGELTVGRRTYCLVEPEALRFAPELAIGLDVGEPAWPDRLPAAAAAADRHVVVMVFSCGTKRFAAPFADVERLAVMPSVIHPIQAPKPILGRSRDDGSLVVSLAGALGIEVTQEPRIVVVVSVGAKEVAFTADDTAGMQQGVWDAAGDTLTLPDGSTAERIDMRVLADRFARPADEPRGPVLPLAKPRDTPAAGRTRLMTIRVNETWYGLSADLIRRVGEPTGYARLYGDSRRFDGIAIVGGDAVPAIDLHRVFQAPRRDSDIAAVMSTRDGTVALMCDALGRIEDVQTDRIEVTDMPYIAGRVSRSTQTIHLIDLRRIVQQDRAA